MSEYRTVNRCHRQVQIRFRYGGDLIAHGLRVDVPSPDMDEDDIDAFLASLGLLMPDSVTLANVEVFAEPHKGTRGGPRITVAARRRPARRTQPCHPRRDGYLSWASRLADYAVPDQGSPP